MRIDRYVHDERLTQGAAGVLAVVTALHLAGIGKLLTSKPRSYTAPAASPIFQVNMQKLPPPPPRATEPRPAEEPLYADAAPVEETPVHWNLKLTDMKPPVYPPRCLRMGIEGRVKVRVLVGENGRPQEVTVGESSAPGTRR